MQGNTLSQRPGKRSSLSVSLQDIELKQAMLGSCVSGGVHSVLSLEELKTSLLTLW